MLTAILWLAWASDRYPTEFAVMVILTGRAEMTYTDAFWWASDPYRVRGYCRAALELGVTKCDLDLRDLVIYQNDDFARRLQEVRYSQRQISRNIGRLQQ